MMQARELHDEIMAVVEEKEGPRDRRFASWIRRVDRVATSQVRANGFVFEGAWIEEGTVEVEAGPAVFLVKTYRGPGTRKVATYNVVMITTQGSLTLTTIRTDDARRDWGHIRDQVADLLDLLSGDAPLNGPVELNESAVESLAALEDVLGLPRPDIVAAALALYRSHVQRNCTVSANMSSGS